MQENKIFETQSTDLATFLIFEGIPLYGFRREDKIIYLQFIDKHRNINDLEQVFMRSDYKKFQDIKKYVLKKIHEELKKEITK